MSHQLRNVAATFYRGGTSRGLLFKPSALAIYDAPTRDRIMCHAMGSPDPDGRQITGLGGGTSSLSKVAIVSTPSCSWQTLARIAGHPFPGVAWAENIELAADPEKGWDCIFRFGQVPINAGTLVDWGSTCGNLVAAVAHFHLSTSEGSAQSLKLLPPPKLKSERRAVLPLRILAHDTGKVVIARIPVYWETTLQCWRPQNMGTASIAGVPGTAPAIVIESPLEGSVLPTGRPLDVVDVYGEVPCTIVDTGLPTIFVSAESIGIPLPLLLSHPSELEGNAILMSRLEAVRFAASQLAPSLQAKFSPPAPKICIIHPRIEYTNTGGEVVAAADMDICLRALSNGQVHRTVPATTLSAATAASAFSTSTISSILAVGLASGGTSASASLLATETSSTPGSDSKVSSLTVGQPAGLSTASVKLSPNTGEPSSIVMTRTANRIMDGHVLVPHNCRPSHNWRDFMPPPDAESRWLEEQEGHQRRRELGKHNAKSRSEGTRGREGEHIA